MTRVIMKWAFLDAVEAIKKLETLPEEELLGIIGLLASPKIMAPIYEMVSSMTHLDRALFAVSLCHGFHSGYSQAITDLTSDSPSNLHVDYINEQQLATGAAIRSS